jgi:ABC-type sugar transport system ATPase subunit
VLREIRQAGGAVAYISHRLEELRAIADRVTVLRDGRVAMNAPLDDVTNPAIIQAMSGRELVAARAARTSAAAGEVVLSVERLSRRGRLHDVTLEARRGEIVGIAGLMGSGRSRLLRSIFGAERLDSGTVQVRPPGAPPRVVRSVASAIRAGMGLVPEDRHRLGLVANASVVENIGLVTPPRAQRFGLLRRGVLRAIAIHGVETLRIKTRGVEQPVARLSGGNQQKVVLARWLGADIRVLLLDEPTRGVDVLAKAEIHEHLKHLAARGLAVVVVSSELPELLALCDRICVMREGRLVATLPRAAATPAEILRRAIGA